jgi:chromosome segregation ATPase
VSDAGPLTRGLRARLSGGAEDRLGRALSDLLENPLLTGAIGAAFDAREKAAQAQEAAMGALNIPSAADVERLTRRLRSVSLRLEGIEEGVDRLESQLQRLNERLERETAAPPATAAKPAKKARKPAAKA